MEGIIGHDAAEYVKIIDEIGLEDLNTSYRFMPINEYQELMLRDTAAGMKVYWREILARAHCCSTIAILRTRRWLTAMESSARENNLLSFAASFRGFLESAADASTSLSVVPLTLAHLSTKVSRILAGNIGRELLFAQDLEDELIHFSHARYLRKGQAKGRFEHHKARTTQEYMSILKKDGGVSNVAECYKELCDLTHPGASSVRMWLGSSRGSLVLSARQDSSIINRYIETYKETYLGLVMFGFNPAIISLAVLNYYPEKEFHTSALLDWNLSTITAWHKCERLLRNRKVRARRRKRR